MDTRLERWATPRDSEIMRLVNETGSINGAERRAGVSQGLFARAMRRLKERARLGGYEDDVRRVPVVVGAPFIVKGKSTYYNREGVPTQEWVKTRLDDEQRLAQIQEAIAAFCEDVPPLAAPPEPRDVSADIIPWLQIGDAHLGMLAHAAETGENFDLKIAERELRAAIGTLIDELPATYERIVINDLGDFTHYENMKGETEHSGNKLDYDGRFPKMIKVYSQVMRWIVDKALEKALHVDVIVNQGNHSETNDIWMAELLKVAYGATGRVHVLDNTNRFIAYRMGRTLVLTHHSDTCKPADLIAVMINDFREDYGDTEFHYIDIGHVHHKMVAKENGGPLVESWNNLAPNDRWHHNKGYRSRRSISVVFRSRTYGEVGRRLLPVQEIRDRIEAAFGQALPAVRGRSAFTV